ncbi:class II fructose-bisphosphate aldolase [Solicola sp. PLA-1-18]|uniref:class II fructose-bisphosphate aldolase n=1 Tax=Solicola sp. PLA-1-18 TaxID=3380532 RepID=UPI003B80E60F
MALVPAAVLLDDAREADVAVGAFNVITLEHAEAVVAGAERAGRPVVLQLSENAIAFHRSPDAIAAACVAVAREASVDVALHLDHVTGDALVRRTAELGFSSVMYDGSTHPYEQNVAATADAATWASENGVWLEAELGEVGGKDGAHAPGVRTDPAEAAAFVDATGVDSLAVAVGSSHAMTTQDARLDHDLIRALRDAVPVPLVLHGSSGVPDDELRAAVEAGMVKINVGTALNVAFTGAVRARLASDDAVTDPRKYLAGARDAVSDVVAHVLGVLALSPGS